MKVERCPRSKPVPYINTKNEDEREMFKRYEQSTIHKLFTGVVDVDIDTEFRKLMELCDDAIQYSYINGPIPGNLIREDCICCPT